AAAKPGSFVTPSLAVLPDRVGRSFLARGLLARAPDGGGAAARPARWLLRRSRCERREVLREGGLRSAQRARDVVHGRLARDQLVTGDLEPETDEAVVEPLGLAAELEDRRALAAPRADERPEAAAVVPLDEGPDERARELLQVAGDEDVDRP